MATRVDRTYLRGFLVHDRRLQAWPEETSATQAGPRAGEAVPQARDDGSYPDVGIRAYGEQTAGSELTISVAQGGHVGDATFHWATTGDFRGWDNAVHPSTYQFIDWTHQSRYPDCESTPDGVVHVITYRGTGSAWTVELWQRAADTGEWSAGGPLYAAPEDPSQILHSCLAVDGAGSCWCWHWTHDPDERKAQIRVLVRRLGGDWAPVQSAALEHDVSTHASTGYTLGRIRAAVNAEGQVMLLAHLISNSGAPSADVIWQWAADHPSAPLRVVAEDLQGRGYPDVVVKDGAFWAFYLTTNADEPGEQGKPILRVVGSAFDSIETTDAVDIREGLVVQEGRVDGTPAFTEAELAAVCTEDGTVYLYVNRYGGPPPSPVQGGVYRFRGSLAAPKGIQENGWDALGSGSAGTWHRNHPSADTTEYPSNVAACVHRGRVLVVANPMASVSTVEDHLVGYWLGGYSTAARPSRYLSKSDPDRDPLEYGWVPFAAPPSFGWSETTSGTSSGTTSTGELVVSTTSGSRWWEITDAGGGKAGHVRFKVEPTSGGSFSADAIALTLGVTDGSNVWSVTARVATSAGTTQFRLVDTAGATIDEIDTAQAEPVEIYIGVIKDDPTTASCFSFWRVADSSEDTVWQEGPAGTTIPSGTGTDASISFGHMASGSSDSTWGYVMWSWDAGPTTLARMDRPGDMPGAVLTLNPRYVGDGVSIAAVDGPAVFRDVFTIDADAEFSTTRLDPRQFPSPSETWRSTGVDDPATIAWTVGFGVENSAMSSDLIGLYVDHANVRGLYLDGYDATADPGEEWVTLGELEFDSGKTDLPYLRKGDTIVPDPDGTFDAEPWFAAGELVGASVYLSGGDIRKISWNSEGWWSVKEGRRRVVIELEGITGDEAASGTCDVASSRGLLLVNLLGRAFAGYRVSIPDQPTADGFLELGVACLGSMTTFARDFGQGGQETRSALAELTVLANGYAQARSLNDAQRTWTIPLSDLYDEAELFSGDGRYALGTDSTGALVLSDRGSEWSQLEGLLRYAEGPVTPCVYCPLILVSHDEDDDAQVYTAERHMIYGRLGTEVSRDLVSGTPEEGWVWRGTDALVITEEK